MSSDAAGNPDCTNCGGALRDGALFCARCGTRAAGKEVPPPGESSTPAGIPWQELRVVAWLYGLLLFSSLCFGIAYFVQPNGDFQPWFTLVDAFVIFGFCAAYRAEIIALMRPSTFDGHARKMLAYATLIQFALLGAVFYLLEETGIPFERVTDEMQRHHYTLWQLLLLYSVAPALFEEIAFRGIIFNRLRLVLGDREGWLVQAAFFSVIHLSPVIFPTHFAMGLIFGWLRMRTGSLLPGMLLHAAWNAANIVLELYR